MRRTILRVAAFLLVGLLIGVLSHSGVNVSRTQRAVEGAAVVVAADEREATALQWVFPSEDAPVARVAVMRVADDEPSVVRVWARDAREPFVVVVDEGHVTEVFTPRGDRIEIGEAEDGGNEVTVHPVGDADSFETRVNMPSIGDEGLELGAALDLDLIGVAHATKYPKLPDDVPFGRSVVVPITTRGGPAYRGPRDVRYTVSCDGAVECTWGGVYPTLAANAKSALQINVRGTVRTRNLDEPSFEEIAVAEKRLREASHESGGKKTGDYAELGLLGIGAVGTIVAICWAATGPFAAWCTSTTWGAVGATATVAGFGGAVAARGYNQSVEAGILDGAVRMAFLKKQGQEVAKRLRGIVVKLCTREAELERTCVEIPLPDLNQVGLFAKLDVHGTLELVEKKKPARSEASERASTSPPSQSAPPRRGKPLPRKAQCIDSVRVRLENGKEVTLAHAYGRAWQSGFECRYDAANIPNMDGVVHMKVYEGRLASPNSCGKGEGVRVGRATIRRSTSSSGTLHKRWFSTVHSLQLYSHAPRRGFQVVDEDGQRVLDLAIRAGFGQPCR